MLEVVIIVLGLSLLLATSFSKRAPSYLVGAILIIGYLLGIYGPGFLPMASIPSYVLPIVILSFPYFLMKLLNKQLCFLDSIFFLLIVGLSILANSYKAPLAIYAGLLWIVMLALAPHKQLGLDLIFFPVVMFLLEKVNVLFLGTSTEVRDFLFYAKGLDYLDYILFFHGVLLFYIFVTLWKRSHGENGFVMMLAFLSISNSITNVLIIPEKTIQAVILPGLIAYFLLAYIRKSLPSIKGPAVIISFLVHPYFLFFFLLDDVDRKWFVNVFEKLKIFAILKRNYEMLASLAFALGFFVLLKFEISLNKKLVFLILFKIFLIRNIFSRKVA